MKYALWSIPTLLLSLVLMSSPATAGTEYNYVFPQQSYSGSQSREYTVYLPDGLAGPLPMVMTLHGCKQTQNDVLSDWGMKAAADRHGFVLVTPFITTYDGLRNENCWGFWFEQHRHEGAGEVEDLHRIAQAVETQFNIDPERRFITGLSSGGAMTVAAATAHNEYWAAAASASGLPYGEDAASVSLSGMCPGSATFHPVSQVAGDMAQELDDDYPIPMMVLQNNDDCTVIQPAGRNIRDAHLSVFGDASHDTPGEALAASVNCTDYYQENYGCRHETFTHDGTTGARSIVETIFFDGPLATSNTQDTNHGHYWIGGAEGNEGKWAVRKGPVYPDLIWDFFDRHPRSAIDPVNKPVITLYGANPMELLLGETFSDPGAYADDFEDGSVPVTSTCNVDTSMAGNYQCTYTATDTDGHTSTAIRQIMVTDPSQPTETCIEASASPQGHIYDGRAEAGGSFSLRAITTGDEEDIGYAYDSWSTVVLTEGEPGQWYAQPPAACQTTVDPGTGFECQQWYSSNQAHQTAGRAYYWWSYYTLGGNDYLGSIAGSYTWVSEPEEGVYLAGQCQG